MNFISDKFSAPRTIEKMKILGALLELNGTANPAHLITSGAENLSYMKFIETHARAFLALIILSISSVRTELTRSKCK